MAEAMIINIDKNLCREKNFFSSLFLAFCLSLVFFNPAWADCASPVGVEGDQVYNSSYQTMQFCDGTNWISMTASDALAALNCNDTESVTWDNTAYQWVCAVISGADDLGNHTATQNLNMNSHKIINVTDPTLAQDAATKAYADASSGSNEIDPQVNTLTSGKWCQSDGSVINCTADAPLEAELDPEVNTLTSGKWCQSDGSVINCTSIDPALVAESDPKVNTLTSGKWCTTDGSVVNCTSDGPLTSETDPKVNTLTSGKWCTTDGSVVNCATNPPLLSETDPQVGNIATSGQWCRSDGSAVVCDQSAPTIFSESDPQVGNIATSGQWCRSNGSAVVCDRDTPVLTESDPQVGTVSTSGQWCRSNGSAVVCDRDAPVTTETDPQVGAMTADLWCRANGSATAINCANTGGTMTGNLTVEGILYVGANGNNNSNILFYDDNSNATRNLFWADSSNDWFVQDNGNNNRRLWHAGNDGPGSGLNADTVDGKQASAFITSETDPQVGALTANLYCVANADASAIRCKSTLSDRRLKMNIKPLTPMLDKVMQMNPVTFEFKKEPGTVQYGLIAQEFEKIIPELVMPPDQYGYLGIDYMFLSVPLYKALQELETKNKILKERLRKMEVKVARVRAKKMYRNVND